MQEKADKLVDRKEPVVIKKYANRRLYNTETSTYVTLDDLAVMVKSERDFVVFDAKTGDDLTHSVLTQIIVEQESRMSVGQTLLPIPFLRQLIRFYGDGIERMVPTYLQVTLDTLSREQSRVRKQFANAFNPAGAFEAYQEQARKNLALFEQAVSVFSPFGNALKGKDGAKEAGAHDPDAGSLTPGKDGAAGSAASDASKHETTKPDAAKPETGKQPSGGRDELGAMKDQLAAMQAQIEKLARTRR